MSMIDYDLLLVLGDVEIGCLRVSIRMSSNSYLFLSRPGSVACKWLIRSLIFFPPVNRPLGPLGFFWIVVFLYWLDKQKNLSLNFLWVPTYGTIKQGAIIDNNWLQE